MTALGAVWFLAHGDGVRRGPGGAYVLRNDRPGGEGGQEPPELPDDDPSRVWGGFALGLVFALIAAGRGLTGGWDQTAVGLLVGSGGIIVIQLLWLRHGSRRRR